MDDDRFTMQEMNFVVCVLCERYNLVWLRNLYCLTDAEKAALGLQRRSGVWKRFSSARFLHIINQDFHLVSAS